MDDGAIGINFQHSHLIPIATLIAIATTENIQNLQNTVFQTYHTFMPVFVLDKPTNKKLFKKLTCENLNENLKFKPTLRGIAPPHLRS